MGHRVVVALVLALSACHAATEGPPRRPDAAPGGLAGGSLEVVAPSSAAEALSFAEAEQILQRALARDGRDRRAYEGLARLYYERGVGEARGYLRLADRVVTQGEAALATRGDASAELALIRGLLRLAEARPDLAFTAFSRALEVDPSHAHAALALARLELLLRRPDDALVHLEIAGREPSLDVEVRLSEGVARVLLGDPPGAATTLQVARSRAPEDLRVRYNLGVIQGRRVLAGDEAAELIVGEVVGELDSYLRLARGDRAEAARIAQVTELRAAVVEVTSAPVCIFPGDGADERPHKERQRLLELERASWEAAGGSSPGADAKPATR
ncbi:MAG: hypothetical protein R3B09_33550 [Nannocystaceae bacterium]